MTQHDRFTDQALALQMDALLHEAAGVLPSPTLALRISEAVRGRGGAVMPRARSTWLYAAAAMLGLGTVSAVAWFRNAERAAVVSVQDPQPAPKPAPAPSPEPKVEPKPDDKPDPKALPPAKWSTWIADYSDNRLIEVDEAGTVVRRVDEIFGAWDVELVDTDKLLVTEFSVSRVQLMDFQGKALWSFEDLKNPYDADQLPNGNILIADTFGSRVIEVAPEGKLGGKIVWSYSTDIRPFDADRLANGNTLIADVLQNRVIEVSPQGEIVWEVKNLPNIHDADRLPNGNTLVVLRTAGECRELDPNGKIVWLLKGLSSPCDADRLPNGNTLVAENTRVREFDKDGAVVWEKKMTWAVEANRYYKK